MGPPGLLRAIREAERMRRPIIAEAVARESRAMRGMREAVEHVERRLADGRFAA